MTRDEILNMPAGREMDVLISKKLNLFHKHPVVGDYWLEENEKHIGYVPSFSTDIVMAWEIVTKLVDAGLLMRIDVNESCGNELWRCSFGVPTSELEDGYVNYVARFCETAPLAICRAALLAVTEIV